MAEDTTPAPAPVVSAEGLGLKTSRGWVFRDISLAIHPGELVAVTGHAGSGRSSLLLAIAGRFVTSQGKLHLPKKPHQNLALGYVPGVHEPEPALTVAEHFAERRRLLGLRKVPMTNRTLGRELDPLERHMLCLDLALLGGPRLVVVDDVDAGLTLDEQAGLWHTLRAVADRGTAVVAACREATPEVHQTITLAKEN
ncbi:ATP-binding cassette domain-containing protein [Longispora albida]|uniref:ATP-binding cassette domain-containing protein n=1 Tax=Longispora albida TaxID=203523 RepID=UPI0003814C93|nr:ATP-binding cassette domain-containing protein [Longispora albida]